MLRLYVFVGVMLLFGQTAFAQYGNPYQNRRSNGSRLPNAGPSYQEKREPKDMLQVVEERIPFYIEALQLDDFEKEVFKQMLLENLEKQEAIIASEEIKVNDKRKMLEASQKELTDNLSSILTEEELEKFRNLKPPDSREGKKEKRKKKKKNKKNKKDKIEKGTH